MTEADGRQAQARPSAAARALMALITGYRRFIGPMLAPRCHDRQPRLRPTAGDMEHPPALLRPLARARPRRAVHRRKGQRLLECAHRVLDV